MSGAAQMHSVLCGLQGLSRTAQQRHMRQDKQRRDLEMQPMRLEALNRGLAGGSIEDAFDRAINGRVLLDACTQQTDSNASCFSRFCRMLCASLYSFLSYQSASGWSGDTCGAHRGHPAMQTLISSC